MSKNFVLNCYKRNATLMFSPFIFKESGPEHRKFPDNYIEALELLCVRWQAEKERYLGETLIEFPNEDSARKVK